MSFDDLLLFLREQLSERDVALAELLLRRNDAAEVTALMEEDAVRDRLAESSVSEQDFRSQLLYEQGMQAPNRFVSEWFAFNLNLNNVLAAAVCQKHGIDPAKAIVGEGEVADLLRTGQLAKSASLAAALPELGEILTLTEINDLMEREQRIDALRWQWLEEHATFHYFDIEAVLAYLLKASILHRWDDLNREQGEQIFRALIADMKRDVKLD